MKNIAIVCGGNSGEFDISIGSAQMVFESLNSDRYKAYKVVVRNDDWHYLDENGVKYQIDKTDFSLLINRDKIFFDGIFNAIHGTPGEDGKLQGYFDMINIPYTSSNQATSALTFNKYFCNQFVRSFGIKIADGVSVLKGELIHKKDLINRLGLPLFVKPAESGSSVGISKVNNEQDFDKAVKLAFKVGDRIMIEEFIEGREIDCGVIKKGKEVIVFPLTEIISKKEFFDYEAKYTKGMADEITPADIDEDAEQDIKAMSGFLFHQLNCKGFVRFDYILSPTDLYFLEVNTIPGISKASIMPQMAEAYGMSMEEFFGTMVDNMFI